MRPSQKLTPAEVKNKLEAEAGKICFLDVRSQDEFSSGHPIGAVCVPLEDIENGKATIPGDKLVVLSCLSGSRSARAGEALRARGLTNVIEMEGGFSAWAASGLPVNRYRNTIPLMRQVLITAGSLVLVGSLLGFFIHPGFFGVPIFMGAGLTFAGATGWCGLAFMLERMPWNKRVSGNAA